MSRTLTIFRKGLLIVSIPLLAQAVFVGTLLKSASEDAAAQQWGVHTKQVIAKIEETYRRLLEGYAGVRDLILLPHPSSHDPFTGDLARVPQTIGELRNLVADNLPQQARVDVLGVHIANFSGQLGSIERLVKHGDRAKAVDQLDEAARSLADVRTEVDAILAEETRLDKERMATIARASARHFWILSGGGAAIVGASLILALLFFTRVVTRLDVLRDNTRRFAEGKGLAPPLSGGDELAQVDQAFHEMAASLDEQKQENEMFVYSVSHDLRSPLINLQGFSEELRRSAHDLERTFEREGVPPAVLEQGRKLLKENIAESVHYIQAAVDRLARIIDAMLRLSRAGRVQYQSQALDVGALVRKVVDALHDTVREKKAEIFVDPLPEAWGDPTAVEQIFANLLGNAVKYLDPARPGRIEVGSVESASRPALSGLNVYYVKDNGLGIPEAYHDRVFMAFNRLHAAAAPGEGIGLALVRRMVERHGGAIRVESSPGVGTTFFVSLPAGTLERPQTEDVREMVASDARTGDFTR